MLRIICSLTVLFCHVLAYGQQDIKSYVGKNAIPVAAIDPSVEDFTDLQAIGNAIGDARIVMLGEQDHGDAPAFLAKTRIIKYLHQQKGFTVLAFESDFFGLNEGWDALKKDKVSINAFLSLNIFPIWSMCTACQPLLYQYIPESFQTANPLQVTGFDSQVSFTSSGRHLYRKLDSVMRHYQLPVTSEAGYDTGLLRVLQSLHELNIIKDTALYSMRKERLELIRDQLKEKLSPNDFWVMMMENLIRENEQYKYQRKDYWKSNNHRDLQMARNLSWLSDVKFAGKKIVVWAHNYHISKHGGHYPESFLNNAATMGHVFTTDTMRKKTSYIIGFTSLEGTAGRLGRDRYKIKKPGKNSLERWINPAYDQAFIDYRAYNESGYVEAFYMAGSIKGGVNHTVHKAEWSKIFDGVFYIRKMYPCEGRKEVP